MQPTGPKMFLCMDTTCYHYQYTGRCTGRLVLP